MPATAEQFDDVVDRPTSVSREEARAEDAYWQRNCWQERYYRLEHEYEDYAPAYCVGYAGYAQYGGTFAEAERCLISNWERIKGDSRLDLDEALAAIRAAWDRMARVRQRRARPAVNDPSFEPALAWAGRPASVPSGAAVAA